MKIKSHFLLAICAIFIQQTFGQSEMPERDTIAKGLTPRTIPMLQPQWTHFTAKYDVEAAYQNQPISGTLSIRMKKDSIVWFSFSVAMGIQVAKGMITNDTIKLLDLYNKKYYEYPINQLGFNLGIPLGLTQAQRFFLGLPIVENYDSSYQVSSNKSLIDLQHDLEKIDPAVSGKKLETTNDVYEKSMNNYHIHTLFNRTVKLPYDETKMTVILDDTKPNNFVKMDYLDWQQLVNSNDNISCKIPFYYSVTAHNAQEIGQYKMSLKTYKLDPIPSYPFNVNSGYTRAKFE